LTASTAQTIADARSACLKINDASLQGNCLSDVVEIYGRTNTTDSLILCEEVIDPVWQDECYFRLSETQPMPTGTDPSAHLTSCAAAGRYEFNCRYHYFPRYGLMLRQQHDSETAFQHFAALVSMLEMDQQRMAWSQYIKVEVEGEEQTDLRWCSQLAESSKSSIVILCQKGLTDGLSNRLQTRGTRGQPNEVPLEE